MRQLIADVRGWFAALVHGRREDAELREEMEFHLAMEAEMQHARGAAEPVRTAQLKLGSRERWMEESRDARGVRVVLDFAQDVRFALREMRRSPAYTIAAVLAMAIGMAGVTAVFSVINRILL